MKTVTAVNGVEMREQRESKLTWEKIVWIFAITSVLGYVVEMFFCFFVHGYFESKQGMLYGPFCQIYGFGALVLLFSLWWLRDKHPLVLFLSSALVGGIFEFSCSYIQEWLFQSRTWDFSGEPLSLMGGRTSLGFMFFWGILGVTFIKLIYPAIDQLSEQIPRRRMWSRALLIFFAVNLALSSVAVTRWIQRQKDIPARNVIEAFIDNNYHDLYMKKIYPKMQMVLPKK